MPVKAAVALPNSKQVFVDGGTSRVRYKPDGDANGEIWGLDKAQRLVPRSTSVRKSGCSRHGVLRYASNLADCLVCKLPAKG